MIFWVVTMSLVFLIQWVLYELYWLPLVLGLIAVAVALWRY